MRKIKRGDVFLPVALSLFSLSGLIYVLATFPRKERIYPGITFICLGVSSMIQAIKSLKSGKEGGIPERQQVADHKALDNWGTKATGISVLATLLYILFIEFFGFLAASVLLLFGLSIYLGYRNILVIFMVGLVFVGAVYLLFARLHVPVPTGSVWRALMH